MHPDNTTILGYTPKELEVHFAEHLDKTCAVLGMNRTQLLAEIANCYDGY